MCVRAGASVEVHIRKWLIIGVPGPYSPSGCRIQLLSCENAQGLSVAPSPSTARLRPCARAFGGRKNGLVGDGGSRPERDGARQRVLIESLSRPSAPFEAADRQNTVPPDTPRRLITDIFYASWPPYRDSRDRRDPKTDTPPRWGPACCPSSGVLHSLPKASPYSPFGPSLQHAPTTAVPVRDRRTRPSPKDNACPAPT
jgi:hypothetical protein